jgi:general stress protein YciG
MTEERQREIASKGGRAAHKKGTAHEFSTDEARAAGRKGGQSVSQNRDHMAEIGRKGGETVNRNRDLLAESVPATESNNTTTDNDIKTEVAQDRSSTLTTENSAYS